MESMALLFASSLNAGTVLAIPPTGPRTPQTARIPTLLAEAPSIVASLHAS